MFGYVPGDKFSIWFWDKTTTYELFQESISADYASDDRLIDAIGYAENGVDHVYFTDFYNEPRKIRCVIPAGYAPNFLTPDDISVTRLGANGKVVLDSIVENLGSLLSGSYQFTYRMVDPETKTLTKWGALTNPIHVYTERNLPGSVEPPQSAVGMPTTFGIVLNIEPTQRELDRFEYFQIAVIEHVGSVTNLIASLLPITPVSDLTGFEYKANTKIGQIPVDEIVTNHAPIETVKTLSVAQKTLIGGNVKYKNLEYESDPTIVGGEVITATTDSTDLYSDHEFSSTKRGYFRDEVYRFGVTYFDEKGNNWPVKVLDLSSVTDNIIGQVDTAPKQLFANNLFSSAPTVGWSAIVDDFSWFSGQPGTAGVFYSPNGAGEKSDILYQGVTLSPTATNHRLRANTRKAVSPDTFRGVVQLRLAFIDGGVVQSTQLVSQYTIGSIEISLIDTLNPLIIPPGTDAIGFYLEVVSVSVMGTINVEIDEISLFETEPDPVSQSTPDIKFPGRDHSSGKYTLFNSNGRIQTLGLKIEGLDNHPKGAVGFEIVRVPRIKDIQFQSPVVPMTLIQGIGAKNSYPSEPRDITGVPLSYPDAQPMVQEDIYVPRNFFYPEMRNFERDTDGSGELVVTNTYEFSQLFPSQSMYDENKYQFVGTEKLDLVDYAALRLFHNDDTPSGFTAGDSIDTECSGTFYAVRDGDYYFDSAHTGKTGLPEVDISDYEMFDNFDDGASVAGASVMRYENLQSKNPEYATKPEVMRSAVIKHNRLTLPESMVFRNVTFGNRIAGYKITTTGSISYENTITNNYLFKYPGYSASEFVNKIAIANVRLGLSDYRYGNKEDNHEFISTGTRYYFSDQELSNIAADLPAPVDVEVWGGDCFVGPQIFKISDSNYLLSYLNKSVSLAADDIIKYKYFYHYPRKLSPSFPITINAALKMPLGVRAAAQYVQVVLESEYNAEILPNNGFEVEDVNGIPVYHDGKSAAYRLPMSYKYNLNLSKQNDQKRYLPKPQYGFEQDDFQARLVYSDPKIYNSSEQGFDVFRVLNFLDLEEKGGAITKLALSADNLYAIQERHITYLPVGQTQIEQTDANTLQVGTSSFFGRPILLDTTHGSQHLAGIAETGSVIYVPDARNRQVLVVSGQEVVPISDKKNLKEFSDFFKNPIPEKDLIGVYHPTRGTYWLYDGNIAQVWNEKVSLWTSAHEMDGTLARGISLNGDLCLLGTDGKVYQMYEGQPNDFFGTVVVPRVTFVVNPEDPVAKVFDNVAINSTSPLATMDLEVVNDTGTQTILGTIIAAMKEGVIVVKTLLYNNSRLRGNRMSTTIKWADTIATVSAVLTRYRRSSRTPF